MLSEGKKLYYLLVCIWTIALQTIIQGCSITSTQEVLLLVLLKQIRQFAGWSSRKQSAFAVTLWSFIKDNRKKNLYLHYLYKLATVFIWITYATDILVRLSVFCYIDHNPIHLMHIVFAYSCITLTLKRCDRKAQQATLKRDLILIMQMFNWSRTLAITPNFLESLS